MVWWAAARLPAQPARAGRLHAHDQARGQPLRHSAGAASSPGEARPCSGASRPSPARVRLLGPLDDAERAPPPPRVQKVLSPRDERRCSRPRGSAGGPSSTPSASFASPETSSARRPAYEARHADVPHLAFLRFATALRRQGRPSLVAVLQRKAVGRWRMDDLRRCWHILRLVCDTRAKRLVAQAFARGHHAAATDDRLGHWARAGAASRCDAT